MALSAHISLLYIQLELCATTVIRTMFSCSTALCPCSLLCLHLHCTDVVHSKFNFYKHSLCLQWGYLLGFHSSHLIKLYQIGLKNEIEIITVSDSGGRSIFSTIHTRTQTKGWLQSVLFESYRNQVTAEDRELEREL